MVAGFEHMITGAVTLFLHYKSRPSYYYFMVPNALGTEVLFGRKVSFNSLHFWRLASLKKTSFEHYFPLWYIYNRSEPNYSLLIYVIETK